MQIMMMNLQLFAERIFLNDPELRYDGSMAYMSHKELYEEAIKKSMLTLRKIRTLTENGNGGIKQLR